MGVRTKFNLVVGLVFLAGLLISGLLSWRQLNRSARQEVLENAGIMMSAAFAIRNYTVDEIRPLIDLDAHEEFIPETVPAFAATEAFEALRADRPEFSYREATLNPTNPRDQAVDWESDVIQRFRNDGELGELVGERETPSGRVLWMARPIRITDPNCLACHSTPDAAPASLIRTYGDANGFGWQLDEVVGSQIVTVPMEVAIDKARQAFLLVIASLAGIFALLFGVLNFMLGSLVVQPITRISRVADEVSMGNMDIPEFEADREDEIGTLEASFNRMRRSLERAMSMIQG